MEAQDVANPPLDWLDYCKETRLGRRVCEYLSAAAAGGGANYNRKIQKSLVERLKAIGPEVHS